MVSVVLETCLPSWMKRGVLSRHWDEDEGSLLPTSGLKPRRTGGRVGMSTAWRGCFFGNPGWAWKGWPRPLRYAATSRPGSQAQRWQESALVVSGARTPGRRAGTTRLVVAVRGKPAHGSSSQGGPHAGATPHPWIIQKTLGGRGAPGRQLSLHHLLRRLRHSCSGLQLKIQKGISMNLGEQNTLEKVKGG